MNGDSAWVGVIGVLLGVLVTAGTNLWRERYVWKREDRARSYEHRRAAYMDFMADWQSLYDAAYRNIEYERVRPGDIGAEDWLDRFLTTNWVQVQVYGSQDAINAGDIAIKALAGYADGKDGIQPVDVYESMRLFRAAVRKDLGLDPVEDDLLPG